MATSHVPIPSSLYDEKGLRDNLGQPYQFDIEIGRNCRDQLKRLAEIPHNTRHANSWGFLFYRLVYTPGSDAAFHAALVRLFSYIEYIVFSDIRPYGSFASSSLDPTPNQELMKRYRNEIVQDPRLLQDADMGKVGQLFAQWVDSQLGSDPDNIANENPRFQVCLAVDQEVIDDVLRLPENPYTPSEHKFYRAIKAVVPNRGQGPSKWPRVAIIRLPAFWFRILDKPIHEIEDSVPEGHVNSWVGMKLS